MNSKLEVNYHIDKLSILYSSTIPLSDIVENNDPIFSLTPDIFIFTKTYSSRPKTVQIYDVSFTTGFSSIVIGKLKNDYKDSITLDVDNRLLYSNQLNLVYRFESEFGLKFCNICLFDVCCDSNQNLPKKLNRILHDKRYDVSRRGGKKILTEKGNQVLGTKVMSDIKMITSVERPDVSYYYTLKPSACQKPIILRGYDKTKEIDNKSHKNYIQEANDNLNVIYRLEVSTFWYEITRQSKNKSSWSHQYIYEHLTDKDFLKSFFIKYLNRFSYLTYQGKKIQLSEYLRLE